MFHWLAVDKSNWAVIVKGVPAANGDESLKLANGGTPARYTISYLLALAAPQQQATEINSAIELKSDRLCEEVDIVSLGPSAVAQKRTSFKVTNEAKASYCAGFANAPSTITLRRLNRRWNWGAATGLELFRCFAHRLAHRGAQIVD
jgi:hypothetical protein